MTERWVKYTSPEWATDQWVNMANVQHLTERRDGETVLGTVITFTNDARAAESYAYAKELPGHFLPKTEA